MSISNLTNFFPLTNAPNYSPVTSSTSSFVSNRTLVLSAVAILIIGSVVLVLQALSKKVVILENDSNSSGEFINKIFSLEVRNNKQTPHESQPVKKEQQQTEESAKQSEIDELKKKNAELNAKLKKGQEKKLNKSPQNDLNNWHEEEIFGDKKPVNAKILKGSTDLIDEWNKQFKVISQNSFLKGCF